MKYCPSCQRRFSDEYKFCAGCGHLLKTEKQQEPPREPERLQETGETSNPAPEAEAKAPETEKETPTAEKESDADADDRQSTTGCLLWVLILLALALIVIICIAIANSNSSSHPAGLPSVGSTVSTVTNQTTKSSAPERIYLDASNMQTYCNFDLDYGDGDIDFNWATVGVSGFDYTFRITPASTAYSYHHVSCTVKITFHYKPKSGNIFSSKTESEDLVVIKDITLNIGGSGSVSGHVDLGGICDSGISANMHIDNITGFVTKN